MTPTSDRDDLISLEDFAKMAGTSKQAILNHRRRGTPGIPEPVGLDGSVSMYRLSDVKRWLATRNPKASQRPAESGASMKPLHVGISDLPAAVAYIALLEAERRHGADITIDRADLDSESILDRARQAERADPDLQGWLRKILGALDDENLEALRDVHGRCERTDPDKWRSVQAGLVTSRVSGPGSDTRPRVVELMTELVGPASRAVHDPHARMGSLVLGARVVRDGCPRYADVASFEEECIVRSRAYLARIPINLGSAVRGSNLTAPAPDRIISDLTGPSRLRRLGDAPQRETAGLALARSIAVQMETGTRAAILVTTVSLSRMGDAADRRALVHSRALRAVVALPRRAGRPFGKDDTAILLLSEPDPEAPQEVLFLDMPDEEGQGAGPTRASRQGLKGRRGIDDTIIDIAQQWFSGHRIRAHNHVVRVSLLDLLGSAEVDLSPSRHVLSASTIELDEQALIGALRAITDQARALASGLPDVAALPRSLPPLARSIDDLVDRGFIEIVPGMRIQGDVRPRPLSKAEPMRPGEHLVLTLDDLRTPGPLNPSQALHIGPDERVSITRPFDLVTARFGDATVRIDVAGGHVVTSPLVILRLGEGLDPWLVAAVLSSRTAERVTTSAGARLERSAMAVPLSDPEAQRLGGLLRDLDLAHQRASELAGDLERLTESLQEVVARHAMSRSPR